MLRKDVQIERWYAGAVYRRISAEVRIIPFLAPRDRTAAQGEL